MKKYRVSTTISAKHRELLKKYTEKFQTQQKALEVALENMESNLKQPTLSQEDQAWIRMVCIRKSLSIVPKNLFSEYIKTTDTERIIEAIIKLKIPRFTIEWQYEKSLKKCSLKEVIYGIVNAAMVVNWFDSVNCVDNGDYYLLKIFHSAGINNSIISKAFFEILFEEYGAKIKVEISENSLFIQVFKNIE